MQEKWAKSLEVLIRRGGRGVTAGSAFSGPGVGRNKRGVVVVAVCVMSTSETEVVIGCHSLLQVFNGVGNRSVMAALDVGCARTTMPHGYTYALVKGHASYQNVFTPLSVSLPFHPSTLSVFFFWLIYLILLGLVLFCFDIRSFYLRAD